MSGFTTLKTSCAALATVLLVSSYGCTTLDPYTREEKVSNATKGAAIGTVAGAAVGYLTAHDKSRHAKLKHTLIGAGVGALGGSAVGHYMDRQEMELRQRLEGSGVSVSRAGENLILNMPGHVTFAVNRADLKPQFFEVLNSVALVLKEYDKTAIEIAGHTDNSGSDMYNLRLSERRADSVAEYLAGQEISRMRMHTIGFGEGRPLASNGSQDGRRLNRRVELTLMPLTQS